ncbi:MAG: family 1 extracellular solute-binding protein [Paenibacillaceae bacterium]|nr:family 1 extracellular solute-binding protein [Paenibacillaceae bacterium]
MSKMRWFCMIVSVAVLVGVLLSGCSGSKGAQTPEQQPSEQQPPAQQATAEKPHDPVKIVFWDIFAADTDQYLQDTFAVPVKKKYPYIDMQIIKNSKDTTLDKLISEGNTPDLLTYQVRTMTELNEYNLFYDITDLAKKNKVDLNRFDASTLDIIKASNDKNQLVALPYKAGGMALFYNIDIFDKFGVPYPKDGMTWDQVLDTTKKVARSADGVDYVGFNPGFTAVASSLTATIIDAKTGKANLSTPEWKQSYNLYNQIISIPGNRMPSLAPSGLADFRMKKNLAMSIDQNIILQLKEVPDLNWDMATMPVYPGKPIIGTASAVGLFVTSTSKNKEAAFDVIETVTSNDRQIALSKDCGYPSVNTPEVMNSFCANDSFLKSKNLQAILKFKPDWPKNPTIYDSAANAIVSQHSLELFSGKDINTVTRETEEEIDKKVAELKAAK